MFISFFILKIFDDDWDFVLHTGISVYNIVVLCLIGVPVALVMKEQVDASYALNSLFIFFATSMTLCLVFIPKVSFPLILERFIKSIANIFATSF